MKKMLIFILIITCILGVSGCKSGSISIKAFLPSGNTNEKNRSEEDIVEMFSQVQEADWEYVDCVLIADYADDCVGAVLFLNRKEETSNVAFFDADGHYQRCGLHAKASANPDFEYLGEGSVRFQLETEEGVIYHSTITRFLDGGSVIYKGEDDLYKQQ